MDLTDPANRRKSEDARFIERVFTPGEAGLIFSAPEPDRALWSIWACKEAAFKALSKVEAISSSPLKYSVSLDISARDYIIAKGRARMLRGSVATPAGDLPLRLVRNNSCIHAIASTGTDIEISSVFWVICNINLRRNDITPHIQSMLVRRAAKMKLAKYINADPQDMEIVRRKRNGSGLGPPVLLISGEESGIEISLSHDGVFLAYAFLLESSMHSKEFFRPALQ